MNESLNSNNIFISKKPQVASYMTQGSTGKQANTSMYQGMTGAGKNSNPNNVY